MPNSSLLGAVTATNQFFKRGFTLIELLVVIAIIAILATIVTYSASHIQSVARDTERKSDLTAISEGFIARANDKTCDNPDYVGQYPNTKTTDSNGSSATNSWESVSLLSTSSNEANPCSGSFIPNYLSRVPTDPQPSRNLPYVFNLNALSSYPAATHFRLAASLENFDLAVCKSALSTWKLDFSGEEVINAPTSDCTSDGYNYIIGQ